MSEHVEVEGKVTAVNRGKFVVTVLGAGDSETDLLITAQLSGKMRINKIRVILGDRVSVKLSPTDTSHGIISARL